MRSQSSTLWTCRSGRRDSSWAAVHLARCDRHLLRAPHLSRRDRRRVAGSSPEGRRRSRPTGAISRRAHEPGRHRRRAGGRLVPSKTVTRLPSLQAGPIARGRRVRWTTRWSPSGTLFFAQRAGPPEAARGPGRAPRDPGVPARLSLPARPRPFAPTTWPSRRRQTVESTPRTATTATRGWVVVDVRERRLRDSSPEGADAYPLRWSSDGPRRSVYIEETHPE